MIRCEIFDPTNTVYILYNYIYIIKCMKMNGGILMHRCTVHAYACVFMIHCEKCVLCVGIIWNSSLLNSRWFRL